MKLNNKGFAITTIIYSLLVLFMLLFVSLLGMLLQYKKNLELLIESGNGTREILTMKEKFINNGAVANESGYYNISGMCYRYLLIEETAKCD